MVIFAYLFPIIWLLALELILKVINCGTMSFGVRLFDLVPPQILMGVWGAGFLCIIGLAGFRWLSEKKASSYLKFFGMFIFWCLIWEFFGMTQGALTSVITDPPHADRPHLERSR